MIRDATLRLEDFIQAVQSQLDNAQAAMRSSAQPQSAPADLRDQDINPICAPIEFADSEIRIRPAGRGEKEASNLPPRLHRDHPPGDRGECDLARRDPDDQSLDELGEE